MASQEVLLVPHRKEPIGLESFLASKLHKVSLQRVQHLVHLGAVMVNGEKAGAAQTVIAGDRIEVHFPFHQRVSEITPEDIPLHIIHEDERLLVINKPSGMSMHQGLGHYHGTVVNAVAHYFESSSQAVNMKDATVHRIDKDTSGLVIFAKSKTVKSQLEKLMQHHAIQRTYIALAYGLFNPAHGSIHVPVGRDPEDDYIIRAFPNRDGGKEAVTHYRVLEQFQHAALVQCNLEHGRTHQIRIHLQYLGHALLGDHRYPPADPDDAILDLLKQQLVTGQLLHAQYLHIPEEFNGEAMDFEAPIPQKFQNVIEILRG